MGCGQRDSCLIDCGRCRRCVHANKEGKKVVCIADTREQKPIVGLSLVSQENQAGHRQCLLIASHAMPCHAGEA